MINIMIDLETAATTPNAAILSIGAVRFIPEAPYLLHEFKVNVNLDSCKREGLMVQQETMEWWEKQSPEAQRALITPRPRPIRAALNEFKGWYESLGSDKKTVWAKPATFDCVILEHAFRAVSYDCPWDFRTPRDLHTLFTAASLLGFRRNQFEPTVVGVNHDALYDAKEQAEQAGRIMELMLRARDTKILPQFRNGQKEMDDLLATQTEGC